MAALPCTAPRVQAPKVAKAAAAPAAAKNAFMVWKSQNNKCVLSLLLARRAPPRRAPPLEAGAC